MIQAMFQRFAEADHHCGAGGEAESLSFALYVQPTSRALFEWTDAPTNLIIQNLRAAARHTRQTRRFKFNQHFGNRHLEHGGEIINFRRRETIKLNRRIVFAQEAQQAGVPRKRQIGMVAALHQHPRTADAGEFGQLVVDFLVGANVGFGVARRAVEAAELAICGTYIGIVDVAINQICD